jgi:hypothetical protein
MTTKLFRGDTALQDALYALSLAKPAPSADTLDELVRRYPEFATELTEMAVELALEALRDDEDGRDSPGAADTSSMVLKAMSRFHNRLHTVKTEQRASAATAQIDPRNPFAALNTAEMRALGQRLNATTVFVLKLRDRLIESETMTEGFKRRVADELKAPLDLVAAHFAGQSTVGALVHFKADQKPEAIKKQSFEEAVRSSGLTDEQQSYLLSL